MSSFAYADSPFPIPGPMRAAHRRVWERLAAPGTWWSGNQRVAIARATREARHCRLCRDRKAALSPGAVAGEHESTAALPAAAVEAAHLVASDPASLSRAWYARMLSAGLTDAEYVELVGVVVVVVDIDAFHRALGIAPEPLPSPQPGEPSRRRPATQATSAWVPFLSPGSAEAEDLFGGSRRVPNIGRALSLVPEAVRDVLWLLKAHYLAPDDIYDPEARRHHLQRPQMELIAGRVSALNQCFY